MKPEEIYAHRQSAGHTEVTLFITSVIGIISAIIVLFTHGWLPSLALLILGLIAFGLSRLFDFIGVLLAFSEQTSRITEHSRLAKDKTAA
ncbi:MAG TPA: hypothetical protein VK327_07185 [Candidatus Paceibacterota bacterium]|nr:hypothetical protein [Candidatus Paceibacterota bacterium]